MDNKDDKETLENNIEHGNMHAVKKEIKWIRIIFDEGKKIGLGLYLDNASSVDEDNRGRGKESDVYNKDYGNTLKENETSGIKIEHENKDVIYKENKKSTLNLCFIFPWETLNNINAHPFYCF